MVALSQRYRSGILRNAVTYRVTPPSSEANPALYPARRRFSTLAWVKYLHCLRTVVGMSIYSMFGLLPRAVNIAVIRSRKLRALPLPTLKMPHTLDESRTQH